MLLLAGSADEVVEVSGKGSSTNARLDPPFWIFPPLRPQLDIRYDVASEGDIVDVGAVKVVLAVSIYMDASVAGDTIGEDAAIATSPPRSNSAPIEVKRARRGMSTE